MFVSSEPLSHSREEDLTELKEVYQDAHTDADSVMTPELEQRLEEMKTEVVNVTLSVPEKRGMEVVFNIWDFGGQHVYYTSHQTFLSTRAIYLLVLDMSKSLDTVLVRQGEDRRWKDNGEPRTVRGKHDNTKSSFPIDMVL